MFPDSKISSSIFRPMTAGGKTFKKRAAPSQIGPESKKKIHSEKPSIKDEKPSVVKRGRPVTLPKTHDSDTGSDEEVEISSEEDAKIVDEDEQMPDVPTKDPNGGYRALASELHVKLMDRGIQLQRKRTRHRKFSSTSARLQNLTPHCSKTPNAYGALPCGKTLGRSGRSTSPIS